MKKVVEDMVKLNHHLTIKELMSMVEFEEDGCTLKSWNLSANGLTALPESIGDLTLTGSLRLNSNRLTTLPESFGSLSALTDLNLKGWLIYLCSYAPR